MSTPTAPIEQHPDLSRMRVRYEQLAETPTAQVTDGLTVLSGLYLAMSAWVVGFTDHSALTMTNMFVGITVALLALGFASAFGRMHGIVWLAPLLGVWTIIAPWVVADAGTPATSAIFSNVIVGALIMLMALPQLWTGLRRPTT
ncbi:MAG: SPW repeat protein [bacterium]